MAWFGSHELRILGVYGGCVKFVKIYGMLYGDSSRITVCVYWLREEGSSAAAKHAWLKEQLIHKLIVGEWPRLCVPKRLFSI